MRTEPSNSPTLGTMRGAGGKKSYSTWIWIALIAIVFLSIAGRWIFNDSVRARWILAHAANEFTAGRVAEAKSALERASQVSADIALDKDYWRYRFEILESSKALSDQEKVAFEESIITEIQRLESTSDRARVAMLVSNYMMEKRRYKQAIAIMESGFPSIAERDPEFNNQIAYTRALAKFELGKAIEEINSALQVDQDSSLIDTKAWVLHQMSEDAKAIEYANVAIEKFYRKIYQQLPLAHDLMLPDNAARVQFRSKLESFSQAVSGQEQTTPDPESDSPSRSDGQTKEKGNSDPETKELPSSINTRVFKLALKQLATLRFHRACILDALGRDEEAVLDYFWLDHFGFTDTDNLL